MTLVAIADDTTGAPASDRAIAAVLFDWDCTLLDSRAALLGAWHESTEAVIGRRYPETAEEEQVIFTLPGAQIWPGITRDDAERQALIERFQQAYERTGESVRAFAGVPEALRALREAGISTAVVTSKARRRFSLDASRASLEDLIDVAVCAEDADAPKPDPGPVLKAIEVLGVPAGRAIMAGDTVVDVTAGLRAGTAVVGVAWGASTEDELRQAGAAVVARTPGDLVALVLAGPEELKGTTA
jgi:phosphoglycolate phosphatase-like HAD superfamily hydrolase